MYHLSLKIFSRGKGKSAVAAAAYRAGEKILNEYDGRMSDYTRKKGIIHTEIMLPDNAPVEYNDRAVLWNAVERVEKAKNSQLAREIVVALPIEFNYLQNLNLVREYVKMNFIRHGMCADIAIHDEKKGNPHAHIMLTMRPFNEDKTWGDKQKKVYNLDKDGNKIYDPKKRQYKCSKIQTTDWNEQSKAEEWRAAWADIANEYYERIGITEPDGTIKRIDHRSFERQGIEQIPTIHLGVAAHQMEQKGIRTERGDINRAIKFANQKLRNLGAKIAELKSELEILLTEKDTPPTAEPDILETLKNMLSNPESKAKVQRVTSLSVVKSAIEFLERHKISTLSKLQKTVSATEKKWSEVNGRTKEIDERLKKLNPLIQQAEYYMQFKDINKIYKQQKPKHKDSFYETHRRELTLFESAERFLNANLDGKTLHIEKWKKESSQLTAEKDTLYQEYKNLKEGVRQIGVVRRSIEHILNNTDKMEREQDVKEQEVTL